MCNVKIYTFIYPLSSVTMIKRAILYLPIDTLYEEVIYMQISKRCSVAIHCLICIHEFSELNKVTSKQLALSTGCNPVIIRNIMSALKKSGIITIKPGTGGTKLSKSPQEINLLQICSSVEPDFLKKLVGEHTCASKLCPVGRNIHLVLKKPYQKIRDDMANSMSNITLAEILKDYQTVIASQQN